MQEPPLSDALRRRLAWQAALAAVGMLGLGAYFYFGRESAPGGVAAWSSACGMGLLAWQLWRGDAA